MGAFEPPKVHISGKRGVILGFPPGPLYLEPGPDANHRGGRGHPQGTSWCKNGALWGHGDQVILNLHSTKVPLGGPQSGHKSPPKGHGGGHWHLMHPTMSKGGAQGPPCPHRFTPFPRGFGSPPASKMAPTRKVKGSLASPECALASHGDLFL